MLGRLCARSLALVAALALATPAAASSQPARAALSPAPPPTTSLLFVQETAGGTLTRVARGRYRLRLTGVARVVTTFTDRPGRRAGQEPLRRYVGRWAARGFASDPPNAALVLHDAPRRADVAMLTLSRPRYDARRRTLTYAARPLRGTVAGELAPLRRRADRIPARSRFGAASLFVDDAGAASIYQPITLQVSNAAPGQRISVVLTPNGAPIGWSSGPAYGDASGIQLVAQSGSLPLSQLEVNGTEATFLTTSSGGGGGTIAFSFSLYLVAGADVETFSLRSESDPGVEVAAQVGDSVSQVVTQTQTLFAWNPF